MVLVAIGGMVIMSVLEQAEKINLEELTFPTFKVVKSTAFINSWEVYMVLGGDIESLIGRIKLIPSETTLGMYIMEARTLVFEKTVHITKSHRSWELRTDNVELIEHRLQVAVDWITYFGKA
jgi:hypothetical protein